MILEKTFLRLDDAQDRCVFRGVCREARAVVDARCVRLRLPGGHLAFDVDWKRWPRLRALCLDTLSDEDAEPLVAARSTLRRHLEALVLVNPVLTYRGASKVSTAFSGFLRHFGLRECEDPLVAVACSLRAWRAMESLDVAGSSVDGRSMGVWLAQCPRLRALVCAHVPLGTEGFKKVLGVPSLRLDTLDLEATAIPNTTWLGKSGAFANLKSLRVSCPTDLSGLFEHAEALPMMESLWMAGLGWFDGQLASSFARAVEHWPRLETLGMTCMAITGEAFYVLGRSQGMHAQLTSLVMRRCTWHGGAMLTGFLGRAPWPRLRTLDVGNNKTDSFWLLMDCEKTFPVLHTLDVAGTPLGDHSTCFSLSTSYLPSLRVLLANDCGLRDVCFAPTVQEVHMRNHEMEHLRVASPDLRKLDVTTDKVHIDPAAMVSLSTTCPSLRKLRHDRMTCEEAAWLIRTAKFAVGTEITFDVGRVTL